MSLLDQPGRCFRAELKRGLTRCMCDICDRESLSWQIGMWWSCVHDHSGICSSWSNALFREAVINQSLGVVGPKDLDIGWECACASVTKVFAIFPRNMCTAPRDLIPAVFGLSQRQVWWWADGSRPVLSAEKCHVSLAPLRWSDHLGVS